MFPLQTERIPNGTGKAEEWGIGTGRKNRETKTHIVHAVEMSVGGMIRRGATNKEKKRQSASGGMGSGGNKTTGMVKKTEKKGMRIRHCRRGVGPVRGGDEQSQGVEEKGGHGETRGRLARTKLRIRLVQEKRAFGPRKTSR